MSVIYICERRSDTGWPRRMPGKSPFDAARAQLIATRSALLAMRPGIIRPLSARFDGQELVDRICPVLLSDDTVAILATPDQVGSDHADELAWRMASHGLDPAQVVRYVVSASLLLEVRRGELNAHRSMQVARSS